MSGTDQPVTRRPGRLLTLIFGVVLAASVTVVSEILLRTFIPLHELYRATPYVSDLNERHFRFVFHDLYKDRAESLNWQDKYDPQLGWDYNLDNGRIRQPGRPVTMRNRAVVRILFVGNSFTHGNEVGDQENFPYYVGETLAAGETLNMGVGGYGIDQSVLKYLIHGRAYQPDVVVVGVHTSNYWRSAIDFIAFGKPRVVYDTGRNEFVTLNQPVPGFEVTMAEIRSEVAWACRLCGAFYTVFTRLPGVRQVLEERTFSRLDRVIAHILERLTAAARDDGARVLILHIPPGPTFESATTLDTFRESPQYRHLIKTLRSSGLPLVDLTNVWLESADPTMIASRYYINRSGRPVGHLTPEGNAKVAEILVKALEPLLVANKLSTRRSQRHDGQKDYQLF